MYTLFLKECFQISCARKNNDIYINSSLPSYLFYEKLINFRIFVIIYNPIRIFYFYFFYFFYLSTACK